MVDDVEYYLRNDTRNYLFDFQTPLTYVCVAILFSKWSYPLTPKNSIRCCTQTIQPFDNQKTTSVPHIHKWNKFTSQSLTNKLRVCLFWDTNFHFYFLFSLLINYRIVVLFLICFLFLNIYTGNSKNNHFFIASYINV